VSNPDKRTRRALAERDARQGDVMVAWVHGDQVAHSWFTSILNTILTSERIGPYCAMRYGTDGLVAARNQVAAAFLDSPAEWLFWVDTDMGWAPQALPQLLAAADPVTAPVVGGLAFVNRETETDGFGGYRCNPIPTLYAFAEREDGKTGFTPIYNYPRDALVPVAATGSAFILIHRSVMQAVNDKYPGQWYTRAPNPSTGQILGEDMSFCVRVAACGYPIHVHTGVKTTHLKPRWLQEDDYQHPDGF
jgi:hypothetical protein